ncbi:hypothetical protein [Bacillus cereus]|uniref:hypothetical protein n=1 Tax=Bacillus cereus TaxID=1396 RepID=UPI000BF45CAE|nr:hypothetical protein [Bacillus cereus]PEZ63018.1 hypothetical protein CN370_08200 [Bacillus cereus]PEZ87953.1 hypothetical protein CN376_23015 [Bacillus cereus]PFK68303.1 hypothetical protein COJ25_17365 [Bacillus cereus]PFR12605.1 hypothetical protein COK30_13740 [Bacillus cereus]
MEEKLEKFDKKVNAEVLKLISSLGFKTSENASLEEEIELSREMGAQGIELNVEGDTSEGKYVVTIQLTKTLELIL